MQMSCGVEINNMNNCYNCGEPLELDFYWIANIGEEQMLGEDVEKEDLIDEWVEFEICKNCHCAQ